MLNSSQFNISFIVGISLGTIERRRTQFIDVINTNRMENYPIDYSKFIAWKFGTWSQQCTKRKVCARIAWVKPWEFSIHFIFVVNFFFFQSLCWTEKRYIPCSSQCRWLYRFLFVHSSCHECRHYVSQQRECTDAKLEAFTGGLSWSG